MNQGPVRLSQEACQALQQHSWPGNVRELDNAMQRALILQQGGIIQAPDLCLGAMPGQVMTGNGISLSAAPGAALPTASVPLPAAAGGLGQDVKQREFQLILEVLRAERGRRKEAAERLGISPRTLRYKLAQMRDAGVDVEAALFAG